MEMTGPGTIDDMVADAATSGYKITARLIRDWTEQGLLDYPQRRSAGKGHGSAPALYPASQRNLLMTLLQKRPDNNIRSLARIPVGIWMYWGDDYVPIRQARRALMTWVGDARASKQRARETARAILGQIDSPEATPRARRELLDVLTQASYIGRIDFDRVEQAIRAVFEPDYSKQIRKAIGHPSAPFMTDSMVDVTKARLTAVTALAADRVTDEALIQARDAHVFAYAEWVARQPFLAFASPPGAQLYAPVTADDTLSNCCGYLLSAIGLEIMYPADAERLRQTRSGRRRPSPTEVGLTAARNSAHLNRAEDLRASRDRQQR
jgi:hypothetical protein